MQIMCRINTNLINLINLSRLKSLQDILSSFKIFELFEKKSTKQKSLEEQMQGNYFFLHIIQIFMSN